MEIQELVHLECRTQDRYKTGGKYVKLLNNFVGWLALVLSISAIITLIMLGAKLDDRFSELDQTVETAQETADAAWETANDVDDQVEDHEGTINALKINQGAMWREVYGDKTADGLKHCLSHCDLNKKWMGARPVEHIECRKCCTDKYEEKP